MLHRSGLGDASLSDSGTPTHKLLTRRACLVATLALAGCATPAIVFDRTNLARLKHVGVLTPGFADQPTVAVLPPTNGAMFLLINNIQQGNRSREFAEIVGRANVNLEGEFSAALLDCLRTAHLDPTLLPANPRRTTLPKTYDAPTPPDVDAVLDVIVTRYGYYAVRNDAPFMPSVNIQARLVDPRSRAVLMQDTLDMVNIAPADPGTPAASYQDYKDIAADPAGAVRALQAAMRMAAAAVCNRLT